MTARRLRPLSTSRCVSLNVQEGDNDFYSITVLDGETLTVDLLFSNAIADVDLYLWDPLVACDTRVVGPGATTGALAVGFSSNDNEQVSYANTTGFDRELIIEVDMFTPGGCNDYVLDVNGSGTFGLGFGYCIGNPNSTGATAGCRSIIGSGSWWRSFSWTSLHRQRCSGASTGRTRGCLRSRRPFRWAGGSGR